MKMISAGNDDLESYICVRVDGPCDQVGKSYKVSGNERGSAVISKNHM